jgi:tetratricopeptide (TPR) repeat protein
MRGGRRHPVDRDERREDLLRPSRYLGYDRDALGMHLVRCEAYEIAESQLRRAVWLNPFEADFKQHLAWCLYKQERFAAARDWILEALAAAPDHLERKQILQLIEQHLASSDKGAGHAPGR